MASRKSVKLDIINNANRIVIKVGSSLLIQNKNGSINKPWMKSFADDISFLIKSKKEILIVSSGAIALGKNELKIDDSLKLNEKQAAASVGQIVLAKAWKDIWGAGQGIGLIEDAPTVESLVERIRAEFNEATSEFNAKAKIS